ncbi:MAG: hypothetical protein ACP5EN_12840, partial [Rhodovulum sp.]
MSVDLDKLLKQLENAARRGAFEEFEALLREAEAAIAALPPEAQAEIAGGRRAVAAARNLLVHNAQFLKENEALGDALLAAEARGETGRARRLSDALYRRGKAIMATLRQ